MNFDVYMLTNQNYKNESITPDFMNTFRIFLKDVFPTMYSMKLKGDLAWAHVLIW